MRTPAAGVVVDVDRKKQTFLIVNGVCEFVRMIVRRVDVIWEFGFECSGWMSGTRGCALRLEWALALGEMSFALGEPVFRGVDFRDRDGFWGETFVFGDRIGISLVAIRCFRVAARSVGGSGYGVEHKTGSTGCSGFCGVQEILTGRAALGERARILSASVFNVRACACSRGKSPCSRGKSPCSRGNGVHARRALGERTRALGEMACMRASGGDRGRCGWEK